MLMMRSLLAGEGWKCKADAHDAQLVDCWRGGKGRKVQLMLMMRSMWASGEGTADAHDGSR